MSAIHAGNLGFPRMGKHRELKFALESYWSGKSAAKELETAARDLRTAHWRLQAAAGIGMPPSNDFSLYDHVLDMALMLGAVPSRFADCESGLPLYFAMARGTEKSPPLEMTKWFDTNYHYVVPEFESGMRFEPRSGKAVEEYQEAKALGIETRPVLLGPASFLLLGKPTAAGVTRAGILPSILPLYQDLLRRLASAGAEWVQIDEPCLALDLGEEAVQLYREAYRSLASTGSLSKLLLATYFGCLGHNLDLALSLGTAGLHLDLVRAPEQLSEVLQKSRLPEKISLGLVNGRNIWRADLGKAAAAIDQAVKVLGSNRIEIAPSCSLLHAPFDLSLESKLDPELRGWMAFAVEKLDEVALLAKLVDGEDGSRVVLEANARLIASRKSSPRVHRPEVARRLNAVTPEMASRKSPYPERKKRQSRALRLPLLPTTTIGSFPQTAEVRKTRAEYRHGRISKEQYDAFLKSEIEKTIRFQENIGLDVLVHGEFERNDMVEYFGEQLDGFAFTENGWVQSYGSRCVKPPVIYGDVARPRPMTVEWSRYAQSLSSRPVKGMLTGPVTILKWSFVRDDQPRSETCHQIALAIRDEVADLEAAGIRVIQIDEPALREGLPLARAEWPKYLNWSVDAFRLASSGAKDETQVHTHMCYSEFNDIIESIVRMDADVISVESSRSRMELLEAFHRVRYPNDIGPGVYDIHSPRIPSAEEMEGLLKKALEVLTPEQLWVNPDCGLKTRGWKEVRPALENMVHAAGKVRASLERQVVSS